MTDLTDEELARYQDAIAEVCMEPLEYVKHDTNAREDDALARLVMADGLEAAAVFWIVVECLASRKGHCYSVGDDAGLRILASHMSTGGHPFTVDEVRAWLGELARHGLIDAEAYAEGRLANRRISAQAYDVAEKAAQKRAGAWKTNRARAQGKR